MNTVTYGIRTLDYIIQIIMYFDEARILADLEEELSETFKFYGTAKLEWGCNVTFRKE